MTGPLDQNADVQMSALAEPAGLWSVGDVARFLGFSVSWVRKEQQAARLPFIKIGNAHNSPVRFIPAEIRAWAEAWRKTRATGNPEPTEKPR